MKEEVKFTPQYLIEKGFKEDEDGYFVEPNLKDRDKIWVSFDRGCYRVWHGKDKTFITLHTKIEWFETCYLMAHGDNGIYQLADA
jgi:hypothetical protein